jgi:hypothetical protein
MYNIAELVILLSVGAFISNLIIYIIHVFFIVLLYELSFSKWIMDINILFTIFSFQFIILIIVVSGFNIPTEVTQFFLNGGFGPESIL